MTQIVPTVTVPVTIPELGVPLTPALAAGLAREIAIGLRELPEILEAYKISAETYEKLKAHEFFQKLVDLSRIEWHAAANTQNRLALEAAATAEAIMPAVYARAIDPKEPLNHVVDYLKWLADVGGLKHDANKGTPGERFQITINLGADTKIEFDGSKAPLGGDPNNLPALPLPSFDDKEDRV
jgi:hypothetical protein